MELLRSPNWACVSVESHGRLAVLPGPSLHLGLSLVLALACYVDLPQEFKNPVEKTCVLSLVANVLSSCCSIHPPTQLPLNWFRSYSSERKSDLIKATQLVTWHVHHTSKPVVCPGKQACRSATMGKGCRLT